MILVLLLMWNRLILMLKKVFVISCVFLATIFSIALLLYLAGYGNVAVKANSVENGFNLTCPGENICDVCYSPNTNNQLYCCKRLLANTGNLSAYGECSLLQIISQDENVTYYYRVR